MARGKLLTPREMERAIDLGRLGPLYINEMDLRLEAVGLAVGPIRQQDPFRIVGIQQHYEQERSRWMDYHLKALSEGRDPESLMDWDEWINGRRYSTHSFTRQQEWTSRGIWVSAIFGWHQMIFDPTGKIRPDWWQSAKHQTFQAWLDSDLKVANKRGVA